MQRWQNLEWQPQTRQRPLEAGAAMTVLTVLALGRGGQTAKSSIFLHPAQLTAAAARPSLAAAGVLVAPRWLRSRVPGEPASLAA